MGLCRQNLLTDCMGGDSPSSEGVPEKAPSWANPGRSAQDLAAYLLALEGIVRDLAEERVQLTSLRARARKLLNIPKRPI